MTLFLVLLYLVFFCVEYARASALSIQLQNVDFRSFNENYGLMQEHCLLPLRSALENSFGEPNQNIVFVQLRPAMDEKHTVLLFTVTSEQYGDFPSLLAKWKNVLASSFGFQCGLNPAEIDRTVFEGDPASPVPNPTPTLQEERLQKEESLASRRNTMKILLTDLSFDSLVADYTSLESYYNRVVTAGSSVLQVDAEQLYVTDLQRGSVSFGFSYYDPNATDSAKTEEEVHFAKWNDALANEDSRITDLFKENKVDFKASGGETISTTKGPTGASSGTATDSKSATDTDLGLWQIVGIVLGGVFLVVAIAVVGQVCYRKMKPASDATKPPATVTPRSLEGQYGKN